MGETMRVENERFRKHLKTHGYVERRLRHMGEAVEDQIDCTACANCCRVAAVPVLDRDIEKLAKFFRLPVAKFTAQYIVEQDDGKRVLRRTADGCVFLSGNECTVYEARPKNCVDFPHVIRGEGRIVTRMWEFVDRACYCPIVFNALEVWKEETRFRR